MRKMIPKEALKVTKMKYESDSDSDSETESKKMIMKLLKRHSKKHGRGFLDDIGGYVTDKKGLASDVLQYGLPATMGAIGSIGGPAGAIAGKEGGVLLSQKIAKDNDMSRRSQDPLDSNFLRQTDANQSNQQSNYDNPFDPLTKEERAELNKRNRKMEQQERDGTRERYDYTDLKRGIIKGNAKMSKEQEDMNEMFSSHGMGIHIDVNSHNASGRKAKTGMGFFDDLAGDKRIKDDMPIKHHGYIEKPINRKQIPEEMKVGEGLRSRKKSKDHVSRRAFDEYIKNEMDRMARKDLAESRAVRAGKKAKPAGGYGYGLKGSPEMAEKMAKLRAMKKK